MKALKKAPLDVSGKKRLCWDFSCHRGCNFNAQSCKHSHHQITNTSTLDWTTQAELLRRGGLRTGKKVPESEITARIDQLRTQARDEAQSKKNEGGKAGGYKGGAVQEDVIIREALGVGPDEYDWFETETRESALAELRKGPDASWLENVHAAATIVEPPGAHDDEDYQKRWTAMQKLDAEGSLH